MKLIRTLCCTLLALSITVCVGEFAQAVETHTSAADRATLHNYRLTMDFADKWIAVNGDPSAPECGILLVNFPKGISLAETIRIFDARPGVSAALAKHDLTAREAILGGIGILAARIQALKESSPNAAGDKSDGGEHHIKVSAANMAFIRQHGAAIRQSMGEARRQLQHAHGDKLPDCLNP